MAFMGASLAQARYPATPVFDEFDWHFNIKANLLKQNVRVISVTEPIDSNPEAIDITRRRLEQSSILPGEERVAKGPTVRAATRRRASRNAA